MTITIDNAGRVVIPKEIRDRLNLFPGTELELALVEDEINLKASANIPALREKRGMLVFDGYSKSDIDVAEFINQQRDRQAASVSQ
jgi:AbrB family looped-hinge helix DNA binding protein